MATSYPGSLDAFTNPTSSDDLDTTGVYHDEQHANANDAIEAVETKLGTGSSTATAGKVLKGNTTAGSSAWDDFQAYNLLINPGFEIWQRATSFSGMADNAYACDRWQFGKGGTSTLTVTQETTTVDADSRYSAKLNYSHNTASSFFQKIEDPYGLRGRAVTVSVRVYCSTGSTVRLRIDDSAGNGTAGSYHSGVAGWETLTATKTIAAAATSVTVRILLEATNSAIYVDDAVLVFGSVPGVYSALIAHDDFERAARYYEKRGGTSLYERFGSGMTTSTTFALIFYQFQSAKAVTPSVTISNGSNFGVVNGAGSIIATTSVSSTWIAPQTCSLEANTAGSLTAGQGAVLIANNSLSPLVAVEANP